MPAKHSGVNPSHTVGLQNDCELNSRGIPNNASLVLIIARTKIICLYTVTQRNKFVKVHTPVQDYLNETCHVKCMCLPLLENKIINLCCSFMYRRLCYRKPAETPSRGKGALQTSCWVEWLNVCIAKGCPLVMVDFDFIALCASHASLLEHSLLLAPGHHVHIHRYCDSRYQTRVEAVSVNFPFVLLLFPELLHFWFQFLHSHSWFHAMWLRRKDVYPGEQSCLLHAKSPALRTPT